MSRASLCLHVGFHKTGTTWLQRLVFPELKGVNYIGKCYYSVKGAKNNFNHLYNDSYTGFASKGKEVMELILPLLKMNTVNLASEEYYSKLQWKNVVGILNQYKDKADVKVLFTIRNQFDIINSRRNHNVGFLKNEFSSLFSDHDIKKRLGQHYNYNEVYDIFTKSGIEVFFMPYEYLFGDNKVVNKLSDFLCVDYNDLSAVLKKNRLSRINARQYVKDAAIKGVVKRYFYKENRSLEGKIGIMLPREYYE